jgi:hypothetical protein
MAVGFGVFQIAKLEIAAPSPGESRKNAGSVDRRSKAGDNFKTTLSAGVAPNSEEGE